MKLLLATLGAWASLAFAGDVVDLVPTKKVPDWAVGPLLVLPIERVREGRLVATRAETKRMGTVQQTYAEIDGERINFERIHLWEVPNDGYGCEIITKPKGNQYFKIRLSQNLYDRTFYSVYVQKFEVGSEKAIEQQQHVVWDIKSRK